MTTLQFDSGVKFERLKLESLTLCSRSPSDGGKSYVCCGKDVSWLFSSFTGTEAIKARTENIILMAITSSKSGYFLESYPT